MGCDTTYSHNDLLGYEYLDANSEYDSGIFITEHHFPYH